MNTLFTATVIVHGQPVAYDVTFENGHYTFQPQPEQDVTAPFTAYREDDTWKVRGLEDEIAKHQAVSQLEGYLLQQH